MNAISLSNRLPYRAIHKRFENRTIRKYDQADYNSIIHEMEGKNWSILFKNKTVNETPRISANMTHLNVGVYK
jgi:hypothetical protein